MGAESPPARATNLFAPTGHRSGGLPSEDATAAQSTIQYTFHRRWGRLASIFQMSSDYMTTDQ